MGSKNRNRQNEAGEALRFLKRHEQVELQFTDLLGKIQHILISSSQFSRATLSEGFGKLDGSSIIGFEPIFESDMVMVPIPGTQTTIPWAQQSELSWLGEIPTARILVQVHRGAGRGRYEKDTRAVAETAEQYQNKLGYTSYFGPEPEFFIFGAVVQHNTDNPSWGSGYEVKAPEAISGLHEGHGIRPKEGYYPVDPMDRTGHVRKAIVTTLIRHFGFDIEATHHEVAASGQAEINFRYGSLVDTADRLQILKYVATNVAKEYGMVATFMPKPLPKDNGSGLHTHVSLWSKDGKVNRMFDEGGVAGLSQTGRYVVGGLLEHARALSAIVSPTVNSYHRLIPGFEAPVYLAWSPSNRSAVVRVPQYFKGKEHAVRVEYRAPDPSTNPYLAFSAILMAALDGVKRKIDPGSPVLHEDIYEMTPEKRREIGIRELPRSLPEALDDLEGDINFLKPVFPDNLLRTFIEIKRRETREMASYPNAMEIYRYLDA